MPNPFVPLVAVTASLSALPGSAPTEAPRMAIGPSGPGSFEVVSDTEIVIDGVTYASWGEVADSGHFHTPARRCASPDPFRDIGVQALLGSGADCGASSTSIEPQYDPSVATLRIPVVFHVISRTNGTGNLSDEQVRSQIDILNEDFNAIPGTNGEPGTEARIEFYLATEDPDGNPTTGIVRTVNNTYFNDGGSYWNALSWDTDRYLNFYSNSASGALGYVPGFPASGIAGTPQDRVVVLYSTVGRDAPFAPFDLGRTGTHEVGHYFGLYHTFQGGCAGGSCYTGGDLICDTNREGSPTFGCPGARTSCSLPAPFHNYMDYADDRCMWEFTPEQVNRMRCTLEHYRPGLYEIAADGPCSPADLAEPFGTLSILDVTAFISVWNNGGRPGDFNEDGATNIFDVISFIDAWSAGCE